MSLPEWTGQVANVSGLLGDRHAGMITVGHRGHASGHLINYPIFVVDPLDQASALRPVVLIHIDTGLR